MAPGVVGRPSTAIACLPACLQKQSRLETLLMTHRSKMATLLGVAQSGAALCPPFH